MLGPGGLMTEGTGEQDGHESTVTASADEAVQTVRQQPCLVRLLRYVLQILPTWLGRHPHSTLTALSPN